MTDAPGRTGPKDVFLHLLSIGMLYFSVISFLVLLFQYINHLFPDVLTYQLGADADAIRFSTAALIILFPVYLLTSWLLLRDIRLMPEKATIWVRRWLLYFTLFLASIVIIVDLVTLVFNFLNGDLTARFLLKVLAVFLVAAAVFWYYLWDLRHVGALTKKPRLFGIASAIVVLVTIVAGFFIIGSPFQQRAIRADSQRVNDLQTIQSEIVSYWTSKEKLPVALTDLDNDISGFRVPQDPESNAAYEYKTVTKTSFQLCATFATQTPETTVNGVRRPLDTYGSENWSHGTGHVCFTRTIDPELYRKQGVPAVPTP